VSLNPELQRNLWIELTPARLVIAPLVLGLILALAWLAGDQGAAADTAQFLFFLLALVWGARRAAAALGDEVSGATWDGQRMSALGAWEMTWGKLLGGTAFVWYCALIVLGAGFAAELLDGHPALAQRHLLDRIVSGLLAQSVALLVCLVLLRKLRPIRALPLTLPQLLGIAAGAIGTGSGFDPSGLADGARRAGEVAWLGRTFDAAWFLLAFRACLLAWALVGIFRLVRVELQFRAWAWVWAAFVGFLVVFVEGLVEPAAGGSVPLLLPGFLTGALLVYVALLAEPKGLVAYRGLLAALLGRDWARAGRLLPLWAAGLAVLLPVALGLAVQLSVAPLERDLPFLGGDRLRPDALWIATCLLFLLRDIGVFLLLNFVAWRRRADLAGLIWLGVAYGILPALLGLADLAIALPLLVPLAGLPPALALGPVLVELLLVGLAIRWCLTREASGGFAGEPRAEDAT